MPSRSLIAPSSNPLLERALREKLQRRAEQTGSLGELEPLALRLGLMQNTLKPGFHDPQMVIFAADHGLPVDGLAPPGRRQCCRCAQRRPDRPLLDAGAAACRRLAARHREPSPADNRRLACLEPGAARCLAAGHCSRLSTPLAAASAGPPRRHQWARWV